MPVKIYNTDSCQLAVTLVNKSTGSQVQLNNWGFAYDQVSSVPPRRQGPTYLQIGCQGHKRTLRIDTNSGKYLISL